MYDKNVLFSLVSNLKGPIKSVSLNNHPCQTKQKLVDINSYETLFCSFPAGVNKYGGICNTINN